MNLSTLFIIVAVVFFVLATLGVGVGHFSTLAAGLLFFALGHLSLPPVR